jgi:hypothetical protein
MAYFTELDSRRPGDMNGTLRRSAKIPMTGH